MFTGLIEDVGTLLGLERQGRAGILRVRTNLPTGELAHGESIAVNGACLTVEEASSGIIRFHCLAETLSRTNLGSCPVGARLNLERALQVGARLGGHIVTGHVDFCAKVLSAGMSGDDFELVICLPAEQRRFFVEKGSVAINGVSLTVAGVSDASLRVCLIPTTLAKTNLESLHPGALVNIESDILGKYALNAALPATSNVTMQTLIDAGF